MLVGDPVRARPLRISIPANDHRSIPRNRPPQRPESHPASGSRVISVLRQCTGPRYGCRSPSDDVVLDSLCDGRAVRSVATRIYLVQCCAALARSETCDAVTCTFLARPRTSALARPRISALPRKHSCPNEPADGRVTNGPLQTEDGGDRRLAKPDARCNRWSGGPVARSPRLLVDLHLPVIPRREPVHGPRCAAPVFRAKGGALRLPLASVLPRGCDTLPFRAHAGAAAWSSIVELALVPVRRSRSVSGPDRAAMDAVQLVRRGRLVSIVR